MMKSIAQITFLLCLLWVGMAVSAEAVTRVTLRSKATVEGTIIFQNDDVLVIRDKDNKRFQYPMQEVEKIEEVVEKESVEKLGDAPQPRKVGLLLQISGGAASAPLAPWGVGVQGKLAVGASDLLGKHIFLGGSVGYAGYFYPGGAHNLLPIQLYTTIPLLSTSHAPYIGVGVGYGVALNAKELGGLSAGFEFGYCHRFDVNKVFYVAASFDLQQLKAQWEEKSPSALPEREFTNLTTYAISTLGVRLGMQF